LKSRCCFLLLLAFAVVSTSQAAEMLSIEVDYEESVYTMTSEVWFDATIDQVYDVFRYWDNSTKFSSAIVESRDVEPDAQGRPQFYVRNRGCVLFFCTSFERRGYVEAELNKVIFAFVDPETSDFHLSNESWRFSERDGGTVVIYDLKMRPKFWVPPGIGPYLIKRKLKNNGGRAIDRIEILAQDIIVD
jgi:hypothetical protein